MSTNIDILVRQAVPDDLAYIYKTWLSEAAEEFQAALPSDIFYPAWRTYVTRVLSDPAVEVSVACPSDRPTDILGYIAGTHEPHGNELVWLFVRPKLRRKGLEELLLQRCGLVSAPAVWRTKQMKTALPALQRARTRRNRFSLQNPPKPPPDSTSTDSQSPG